MDELGTGQQLDIDAQVRQQMAMMGVHDFSWWGFLWAVIFGIIGARFFIRGKNTKNWNVLIVGVLMMVYPAISRDPWFTGLVGLAFTGLGVFFEKNPKA